MKALGKTFRHFLLFSVACHLLVTLGLAAAAPAFLLVEELTGNATWTRPDKPATEVTSGMNIPIEGVLATGPESRVLLRLPNDALVSLGANSEVELIGYQQDTATPTTQQVDETTAPASQTELKIRRGVLTNHVRKLKTGSIYKINTPLGVAGVRGTTFQVRTSEIMQGSVAGVSGTITENWIQIVTVATTEGLVGFDTNTGRTQEIGPGQAMIAGDPADGGAGLRTRFLTQQEIDEINSAVNIFPAKKSHYIGGGGPRPPYNLKPTDERLQ